MRPLPCWKMLYSGSPWLVAAIRAEYISRNFTSAGVSSGCACSISATTPEAMAVAWLVPLMRNKLVVSE